jgi:cephalosporin hydroxylase
MATYRRFYMNIIWKDDKRFTINQVNFKVVNWMARKALSTVDQLIVAKSDWMIREYQNIVDRIQPQYIVELGIQRGGSCVFFQQLAQAKKLVAVDLDSKRVAVLDEIIALHGLQENLRPFYGVDQSDGDTLRELLTQEFSDHALDLVIDDASHFLDETRASFNVLFPRLRPGGVYVIEDWPWAHASISLPDDDPGLYADREPLTRLVFEMVLACPSVEGLIDEIRINRNSVYVTRGNLESLPPEFDIRRCSLSRGRRLIAQ